MSERKKEKKKKKKRCTQMETKVNSFYLEQIKIRTSPADRCGNCCDRAEASRTDFVNAKNGPKEKNI